MNISFTVGHAENFPVDLYFLMDLSWSMRSSRDNLIAVTEEIIKAINNKTDDVNIGTHALQLIPTTHSEETIFLLIFSLLRDTREFKKRVWKMSSQLFVTLYTLSFYLLINR